MATSAVLSAAVKAPMQRVQEVSGGTLPVLILCTWSYSIHRWFALVIREVLLVPGGAGQEWLRDAQCAYGLSRVRYCQAVPATGGAHQGCSGGVTAICTQLTSSDSAHMCVMFDPRGCGFVTCKVLSAPGDPLMEVSGSSTAESGGN